MPTSCRATRPPPVSKPCRKGSTIYRRDDRSGGMSTVPILPDLLRPGLDLVFCGTAPSPTSAARRAYYAGPGNRFWQILAESGLTPRRLAPAEYGLLPGCGIGLTDIVKTASGVDADIPRAAYDAAALAQRIRAARPRLFA